MVKKMNTTNKLEPLVDFGQWTFVIIFETCLLISATYLLSALIVFFRKLIQRSREKGQTRFNSATLKLQTALYALFTACVTLAVAKFSLAQVVYFSPMPMSLSTCVFIGKTYQFIHTVGTTCLYSFLWLRQNTLYREPKLSRLATKPVIRFSRALMFVILLTGVCGAVGVLVSTTESDFAVLNGTNACYYVVKTGANAIVVYISYAVVILIQGSLLFLFIHILRLHRKELLFYSSSNPGTKSSTSARIGRLVRYCSIAAVVAASVDLTLVVIDPLIKGRIIQLVTNWLWDCDYTVNLTCTLFCFANWKQILFPWKFSKVDDDETTATAGSSTA